MRKPLIALFVFAAVLFAGVAVAQGQGSSTPTAVGACASPVASPAAGTTAVAASPAAGSATPAACASPVASGAGAQTVDMVDINFKPKEITIAANTDGTITITNQGSIVHNFNIDELNVHSGDVQPGASTTVTINAKAGDYQYYCNIPAHKEAGMVGVLHVK